MVEEGSTASKRHWLEREMDDTSNISSVGSKGSNALYYPIKAYSEARENAISACSFPTTKCRCKTLLLRASLEGWSGGMVGTKNNVLCLLVIYLHCEYWAHFSHRPFLGTCSVLKSRKKKDT